nr:hypothetical protein [Patescibacteria group bacterium]
MPRSFLIFFLFLLPLASYAAVPTSFTPIIPALQCPNSAPDWGSVLSVIQTGINDIVLFASVIITIFIAWAGIAFMMSPVNPEARRKARARLFNAVIGLVIVLVAWLLIDSLMKVIYNSGSSFGPWNS